MINGILKLVRPLRRSGLDNLASAAASPVTFTASFLIFKKERGIFKIEGFSLEQMDS